MRRPSGEAAASSAANDEPVRAESYSKRRSFIRVAVTPGQTALQVMPCAATSFAVALVRPAIACLLAVYAAPCSAGIFALSDEMLMMRPTQPRSSTAKRVS